MASTGSFLEQNRGDSGSTTLPFVGHLIPFVGYKSPCIRPSIPNNQPFVSNYRFSSGFTLIELMITLLVAGILLTWGVSSWKSFMQSNRMSSQVNELLTEMMLARSESIKRRATVTICKSTNLADCDGGGTDWGVGWIVFVENINANTSFDPGEILLRVHDPLDGGNTLTAGAGIENGIRYLSSGLAVLDPGGGLNSVFNLCDGRGLNSGRSISISAAGRPSIGPAINCP